MIHSLHSSKGIRDRRAGFPRAMPGFTLIELLVVIGIIVLLISIALPILIKARRMAEATRTGLDIQAIAAALNAYQQDCGDYPRWNQSIKPVAGEVRGSLLLGWALLSPGPAVSPNSAQPYFNQGDGANGYGFRMDPVAAGAAPGTDGQGKVYGPYLPPDKFKINTVLPNQYPGGNGADSGFGTGYQILDRNGMPFLYVPHSLVQWDVTNPTIQAFYLPSVGEGEGGYNAIYNMPAYDVELFEVPGETPYFDHITSGTAYIYCNGNAAARVQMIVGDYSTDAFTGNATYPNFNGVIYPPNPSQNYPGKHPITTTAPFIIWAAGPDGAFGMPHATAGQLPTAADLKTCDDILNVPWKNSP